MEKISIHIPRWEELPNIDLYLDQVVTLLEEYLGNFITNKEDKIITKTMINNYVKHGIITPPENKKYATYTFIAMNMGISTIKTKLFNLYLKININT